MNDPYCVPAWRYVLNRFKAHGYVTGFNVSVLAFIRCACSFSIMFFGDESVRDQEDVENLSRLGLVDGVVF